MATIWLQFALIILLILANGFFASSEIAVVSARRGRLLQRAEAGSRGARIALQLAEEPNRFLAAVQVGISLVGTFAAAFGGDVLADPLARTLVPYKGSTAMPSAYTRRYHATVAAWDGSGREERVQDGAQQFSF